MALGFYAATAIGGHLLCPHHHHSHNHNPFSSLSPPFPWPHPQSLPRNLHLRHVFSINIKALNDSKAAKQPDKTDKATLPPSTPASKPPPLPKKPVYSMKKGQIVRVDKDKYLNSVNYLSVGHPPYYKGLDYIYEDRGEVLDLRIFETGEYALVAWVGVPTAPAWLPTDMLIKSDKLDYERL